MKVTKISHDKYNNKSQDEKDSEERVSKRKEYSGKKIYIGLDVHKKSWTVAIVAEKKQVERFTQNPDAQELYRHLIKKYPMGEYKCVYEAGFSGFWIANIMLKLEKEFLNINLCRSNYRRFLKNEDKTSIYTGTENGNFKRAA